MPSESDRPGLLLFDEPAASQAEQAYRELLDEIVSLRFAPGEVLAEDALRERLALGRTPIREALQRLAVQRLVTIIPRRGVLVSEINIGDLREIFEVRSPLEGVAAGLAARQCSGRDLPAGVADDLAAIAGTQDFLDLVAVDHRLHHTIHRLARNSYLLATLDWYLTLSIRLVIAAGRRLPAPPARELAETMRDFEAQFAAIAAGDAEAAADLARRHAGFSEQLLRRVM
jgi:DNA-binding GntR family transcriptional regulator